MMMEIQGKVKPDGIVGKPVIEKSTVRPWARFFCENSGHFNLNINN